MDANGLKFWLLSEASHWLLPGNPAALEYDSTRRGLRLARQRRELDLTEDRSVAESRLATVPGALDRHGNLARYDVESQRIVRTNADAALATVIQLPAGKVVTDIAVGLDGVLYIAAAGSVLMHDLRGRWADVDVAVQDFVAWRLSPAPDGGAWVLDRDNRLLARLSGYPISERALKPYAPDVVRPCHENPNPPVLQRLDSVTWPDEEQPVALACSAFGKVACLSWQNSGDAVVRQFDSRQQLTSATTLLGSSSPYSLSWLDTNRIAVLVHGQSGNPPTRVPKNEARVYQTGASSRQQFASGDLYPLKADYDFGPFVHGLDNPVHYPSINGSHALHRLSYPFYTRLGQAFSTSTTRPLDSEELDSVWHRVFIEASIPTGCGIRLWFAASNERLDPVSAENIDWFEHRFGERYQYSGSDDIPVAAWESLASELPFHPGLLPCKRETDKAGLYSVLLQRANRTVRKLQGRYLYVRVELIGPGNATPELFALRAYAKRFSYVEHYLPNLYAESTFAPEADTAGKATSADFLERYINNFEGVLTNLEDRIAASDRVTRAQTVPEEALEWLAQWIGLQFESAWTVSQRRLFIQHAAELYRWHGTIRGLSLALDIASDGAVSNGGIVVLEDYRLRRTFATIISADLDDDQDALTLGGIETGNAFVGDTLFIGDEQQREFLALFAAELNVNDEEKNAIDAFFDRLAFRLTILVHQDLDKQGRGSIQRIAEREVPAHVQVRILAASAPLLTGITALVGVDTYIGKQAPALPARIDRSKVGRGDFVLGQASFERQAELGGTAATPDDPVNDPVARVSDVVASVGEDFTLDGGASAAAQDQELVAYTWRLINEGET